ncbi:retinol dehydrogenase 11-like isoform X2 [Periplaneta americana]|uniref:retinol dehydrogenase 11-like isoform X2 n=1 Tax=Periplaneta americana TaxID=6978 RepID=UPI0037E7165D
MLSYLLSSQLFWYVVAVLIGVKLYIKLTTGICKSQKKLYGKTVIITGANTGIGKATACELARRGARVILACRNLEKGRKVRDELIKDTGNSNIVVLHLDLTSLTSVRKFVSNVIRTEPRLDVLINNAGAVGLGNRQTADKLAVGMQVNHFGPFLLTCLLIKLLKKSSPSRIVMVSSSIHTIAQFDLDNLNAEKSFSEAEMYACSKLANILMANELARRLKGTGVTVSSLCPGLVATEALRNIPPVLYTLAKILMFVFAKAMGEYLQQYTIKTPVVTT